MVSMQEESLSCYLYKTYKFFSDARNPWKNMGIMVLPYWSRE